MKRELVTHKSKRREHATPWGPHGEEAPEWARRQRERGIVSESFYVLSATGRMGMSSFNNSREL